MSEREPFCPAHGKASSPTAIPGLRCDCPEIIASAVGALKRGKWASFPMGQLERLLPGSGSLPHVVVSVQSRVDEAVAEALLAGYRLGLAGGVAPELVHSCTTCGALFLSDTLVGGDECVDCWCKGRE